MCWWVEADAEPQISGYLFLRRAKVTMCSMMKTIPVIGTVCVKVSSHQKRKQVFRVTESHEKSTYRRVWLR